MIYAHVNHDWAAMAGKHSVPRPVEHEPTPEEQIVTLRARVARLERQLDDTLKRLGDQSTLLRRARQLLSLQKDRINLLENELAAFASTQDEGGGG